MKTEMKKIFALGAMLASIFTLTNCTEEVLTPAGSEKTPFAIQVNTLETKTVNDVLGTVWAENDELSVFHAAAGTTDYSANSKFVLTDAEKGYFNTEALAGTLAASNDWYAVYPYNSEFNTPSGATSGEVVIGAEIEMPQIQKGNNSMEHIAGVNYPMWGVAKDVPGEALPAISMTHLSSLVEVEVTNMTEADITVGLLGFEGTEDIVGSYYVDIAGEAPVFTGVSAQHVSNVAYLEVQDGEAIAPAATAKFYLAIRPFTAPAGSSLTLYVNEDVTALELAKDVVFSPGKVKTLKFAYTGKGQYLKLEVDHVVARANEIEATITSADAATIYYSFLTASDARKYSDDEKRAAYLLSSGMTASGTTVVAKASETVEEMKENTSYTLIAMAADAEGKNGPVLTMSYKTGFLEYNRLEVNLAIETNEPGNVVASISAAGAEDFLYWIGKTNDNTWTSYSYLGGTAKRAQNYMYMHEGSEIFSSIKEAYPVVDGMITMADLETDAEYVIVAMAKDASGLYSNATALVFTTRGVSLGAIVGSADPRWESARPNVEWIVRSFMPQQGMMNAYYSFYITIPTGYTAYVLAGSDAYLTDGDESIDINDISVEDKIAKIIKYVDKHDFNDKTIDDKAWVELGYPGGHEFYYYKHGCAAKQAAVIWASQEAHDALCVDPDCHGARSYTQDDYRTGNLIVVPCYDVLYINDGTPIKFTNGYAAGSKTEVVDVVYVVCRDLDGNCYEPFRIEVPYEYFAGSTAPEE